MTGVISLASSVNFLCGMMFADIQKSKCAGEASKQRCNDFPAVSDGEAFAVTVILILIGLSPESCNFQVSSGLIMLLSNRFLSPSTHREQSLMHVRPAAAAAVQSNRNLK